MADTKHNSEDYLRMYSQMVRIRAFEDNANQLYLSAKMPGLTHMYSGEEAVAVGICEALTDNDRITSTHRGHGHCVAKGADFKAMFCELLGKEEGYCRGKGGWSWFGAVYCIPHAARKMALETPHKAASVPFSDYQTGRDSG